MPAEKAQRHAQVSRCKSPHVEVPWAESTVLQSDFFDTQRKGQIKRLVRTQRLQGVSTGPGQQHRKFQPNRPPDAFEHEWNVPADAWQGRTGRVRWPTWSRDAWHGREYESKSSHKYSRGQVLESLLLVQTHLLPAAGVKGW